MKKINTRVIIILATIFLMFSIIVFVIPFNRDASFWIAYLTEVIAIVLQFFVFKSAFDGDAKDLRSKVLGYPLAKVGFVYLVIQSIASIIFIILCTVISGFPVAATVVVCVLLLGGAFLCGVLTDTARQIVREVDESTKPNTAAMRMLKVQSEAICSLTDNPETKKRLQKLAEKFRYSDPVTAPELTDIEAQLKEQLEGLKASLKVNGTTVLQQITTIEQTLEERNLLCKNFKH